MFRSDLAAQQSNLHLQAARAALLQGREYKKGAITS